MDTATSIREYIRDQLIATEESLRDDTSLWGGVIDSVALVQLVAFIEERFGVQIGGEDLTSAHFGTISDIAALVDGKVALA
jgi:acyl carrier protein